jgi:phospholipid-binding lipoprotein MlaA
MRHRWFPTLALAVFIAASAMPSRAARAAQDPWEAMNRRVHALNQVVQAQFLSPLAALYRANTTPRFRRGVENAMANLNEPITVASSAAAGRFDLALNAATRFGINTTLGWGGVTDRADELGYAKRSFGVADALCAWGVPAGPFLMLPLLGPSTLRDAGGQFATGMALSLALGPDVTLGWSTTEAFVDYARIEPELAQLERHALDGYAALRSAYRQRRAAACATDRAPEEPEAELEDSE